MIQHEYTDGDDTKSRTLCQRESIVGAKWQWVRRAVRQPMGRVAVAATGLGIDDDGTHKYEAKCVLYTLFNMVMRS